MNATVFNVIIFASSAATIVFLVVLVVGFGRFMGRLARGWRPEEPPEEGERLTITGRVIDEGKPG